VDATSLGVLGMAVNQPADERFTCDGDEHTDTDTEEG
jgi:hypothetical protein